MTKKKTFNMNEYTRVALDTPDEEVDVGIIPAKTAQGIQMPEQKYVYKPEFRKKKRKPKFKVNKSNLAEAIWSPSLCVDTTVDPEEYKLLIHWWFTTAKEDKEYSKFIFDTFGGIFKVGILGRETSRCEQWLCKTAAYSMNAKGKYRIRKTDISASFEGWLTRESNKGYNRKDGGNPDGKQWGGKK